MPHKFYSHDCFDVDPESFVFEEVNIYFYDGGHARQDQANAFLYYNNILDDVFIAIVDDWNWDDVRNGTFDAFKELGYQILYEVSLPSDGNGDISKWWNGLYVAVIRK